MVRCPVCTKVQLVYVRSPARTTCYYCAARWLQSGDEQDGIIGRTGPGSASPSIGTLRSTTEGTR